MEAVLASCIDKTGWQRGVISFVLSKMTTVSMVYYMLPAANCISISIKVTQKESDPVFGYTI